MNSRSDPDKNPNAEKVLKYETLVMDVRKRYMKSTKAGPNILPDFEEVTPPPDSVSEREANPGVSRGGRLYYNPR